MRTALRTRLRPMTADDIPQVMEIERVSFPQMWPQTAYRRELQNTAARYIALSEATDLPSTQGEGGGVLDVLRRIVGGTRPADGERVLGFLGLWLVVGEAHIVTVAVDPAYRRMGIGERLIIAALETAMELDQDVVTLEVRKSNEAAQRLYAKYGFERVGLRTRYYTDNQEDAVIMTTPELASPGYAAFLDGAIARHRARCPDLWL